VRDAQNGHELIGELGARFGFDVRTISGDEEARLTFLGATFELDRTEPTMVLDIGGGSTPRS